MHFIKLFLFISLINGICSVSYDIVFVKFEVMPESDPTFLNFGTLRILKKSRTEVEFSGKFSLFHKLTNVGVIGCTAFRLNSMGLPPLQVFQANGRYCDLVAKDPHTYENVVKHSDMPEEYCPLQPGNYTIKDLIIHMEQFPEVIPLGEYLSIISYSINNVIKFGYKITISVIAANDN